MKNGRINPRNIAGTDADGAVLYHGGRTNRAEAKAAAQRYAEQQAKEKAFKALPKLLFDVYYFDGYGNTRYTAKKGRTEQEVREKWEAAGRCGEIHTVELAD